MDGVVLPYDCRLILNTIWSDPGPQALSQVSRVLNRGEREKVKKKARATTSTTQNVTEEAGTNQTHLQLASGDGASPGVHARSHG